MSAFQDAYQRTLPAISSLEVLSPEDPRAESCMQVLRGGLEAMEAQTTQMIDMLYQVDVYLAPSAVQNAAGFNPQEALSHVSELFHVRTSCSLTIRATRLNCWPSGKHWRIILVKKLVFLNLRTNGAHSIRYSADASRKWTTWLICLPGLARYERN